MYKVGSLFAGIGGICYGFKQAGCEPVWANEFDKFACRTYRHNFSHTLIEGDIQEVNPKNLEDIDILTSGFPCQAFSIAGKRKGFDDPRGNMFMETCRFIKEKQPKAYLLENVKNLVTHDNGNTIKVIEKTLKEDLGYSFIPFVMNSKEYGDIPQTRERIYIVGFRGEANKYGGNSCTANFEIPEKIELTKTIHDIILNSKQDDKYYYDSSCKYYPQLVETMKSKDTVYQLRRVYVRENKSNCCPTLTANMGTGGHNVPLILDKFGIRKLTPMECVGFQGYPKEFEFPSTMSNCQAYKQAGNSVTVPVIKRIAEAMVKALNKSEQAKALCNKEEAFS